MVGTIEINCDFRSLGQRVLNKEPKPPPPPPSPPRKPPPGPDEPIVKGFPRPPIKLG